MKLTLDRAALLKALEPAARIVERRNTIPILSNLLFDATGDALVIGATDLDIMVRNTVPAEIAEPGSLTIPAQRLHDIARKLPDGVTVTFDGNEQTCTFKAGRSRFQLQTLPVSDFPDITIGDLPHVFTMPASILAEMVAKTKFAISTEETRYYLNGVFLHANEGKLVAVATDGHRLSRYRADLPAGAEGMPAIIVPRKTIEEIAKLTDKSKDDVEVALSNTKIRITIGDVVMHSKLIDGTFPDYQRVIPGGNDLVATVENKILAAAADRVATISGDRSKAVKFSLSHAGLLLAVNNPDAGEGREEIDCDWQGEAFDIGFNARYLADILAVIGGDTVQIKLSEPGNPAIIQTRDDADLLTILMPMRV